MADGHHFGLEKVFGKDCGKFYVAIEFNDIDRFR